MTRNLEARLDGSTPGKSRLSKSAHPREAETPRMREAVPGTAPWTTPGPLARILVASASSLRSKVAISRMLSLLALALAEK